MRWCIVKYGRWERTETYNLKHIIKCDCCPLSVFKSWFKKKKEWGGGFACRSDVWKLARLCRWVRPTLQTATARRLVWQGCTSCLAASGVKCLSRSYLPTIAAAAWCPRINNPNFTHIFSAIFIGVDVRVESEIRALFTAAGIDTGSYQWRADMLSVGQINVI